MRAAIVVAIRLVADGLAAVSLAALFDRRRAVGAAVSLAALFERRRAVGAAASLAALFERRRVAGAAVSLAALFERRRVAGAAVGLAALFERRRAAGAAVGLAALFERRRAVGAAVGLAALFERRRAAGAAVRGLALFGSPAPLVAAVRRPMTGAVLFYPAVAWIRVIAAFVRVGSSSVIWAAVIVVVRAIGPAMVPLSVSVAAVFRLVLGAAAFLAAALPDMLFAIAAGHGAVAVVLLQREHGCCGAGRGGEHADKPDHAERGEKAARSIVRGGGSVPRAISFQFTHPAKREHTNRA
jgi:aryl carrier-like protein